MKRLIIGTRGSKLALVQTELVAEALIRANPDIVIEKKIITTKGDVNLAPIPIDTIGKAWFTKEIEQAIVDEKIDFAVHSLKDVPPERPPGMIILPVLERGDPADVLVAKSGARLMGLPQYAVIGTDSARRKALLLTLRPDLLVKSIRGNVDTRLHKMETEGYDAVVLAAAGLARLGMDEIITERFDPSSFIPAPGQGILAVEIKSDRHEMLTMLRSIVHKPTEMAAEVEQAFSRAIGGGCKLPIGCYANIHGDAITVHAMVGTMDGSHMLRKSKEGSLTDRKKLVDELANEFLNDPIAKNR